MRVLGELKPFKRPLRQGDVFRDFEGDVSIVTDEEVEGKLKSVVLVGGDPGYLWHATNDDVVEIYPDAAIVLHPGD